MTKEIKLNEIGSFAKALHCQVRWEIIDVLQSGPKTVDEIMESLMSKQEELQNNIKDNCQTTCQDGQGRNIKKPTLYYHLRELESVGIIEVAKLQETEHKRAPEKVWKLNMDKLVINFKI
ncbi:MAG: ArsR/SmtB family transcription factor [Promethearchaeota archaeon]